MFIASIKELSADLLFMQRVIPTARRRGNDAFSTLSFDIADGTATAILANWDTAVTVRRPIAGTDAAFRVAIDSLADGIKALGCKSDAEFTVSHDSLTISTASGNSVTIPIVHDTTACDVAAMMKPRGVLSAVLDGNEFAESIATVCAGAATDSEIEVLTGVLLRSDGSLKCMSTDRHKACIANLHAKIFEAFETVVPARPLGLFAKRAAQEGRASIVADADIVQFRSGTTAVAVRTMRYDFPKMESFFDNRREATARLEFDGFAAAKTFKAAKALGNLARFTLSPHEIKLHGCDNSNRPMLELTLNVENLVSAGSNEEIYISNEKLAAILATVPRGVKVCMQMHGATQPAFISWRNVRTLVMPSRCR